MASRHPRNEKARITNAARKARDDWQSDDHRFFEIYNAPLLHMDDCQDPNCAELGSLHEYQKSIDNFTDYNLYEKCCDGHCDPCKSCCTEAAPDCCKDNPNTSAANCEGFVDDCEECIGEHEQVYHDHEGPCDNVSTPTKCDEDCMQCENECEDRGHDRKDCPQDHHTSWESCIATCGQCYEPTQLPLHIDQGELVLYGFNSVVSHVTPCDAGCTPPPSLDSTSDIPQSLDYSDQTDSYQPFDFALDHWQTFQQGHHCAPDPCTVDHLLPVPDTHHLERDFGFTFGCDPSIPGNQYPWQQQFSIFPLCNVQAFGNFGLDNDDTVVPMFQPYIPTSVADQSTTTRSSVAIPRSNLIDSSIASGANASTSNKASNLVKACQWEMPCGRLCNQVFARTDDLKKHVKNSHLNVKGTVTCRWGHTCRSTFGSEAALTGHISKKHLAPLYAGMTTTSTSTTVSNTKSPETSTSSSAEELPWKCTFPGCNKSFMHKQVRDDHTAGHSGGNRAHCPICHQWLNAEGSNFRRHMASHRPEHEHMKCKHNHLGCKRKFPRLDNLRRHEACCKYGKKAAESHHHHHHHHHKKHVQEEEVKP